MGLVSKFIVSSPPFELVSMEEGFCTTPSLISGRVVQRPDYH